MDFRKEVSSQEDANDKEISIMNIVKQDNKVDCCFIYEYKYCREKDAKNNWKVTLIFKTYKNTQEFVAYTTESYNNEKKCLKELENYLQDIKKKDSEYLTYEIKWFKGDTELNTSYFYGKTLKEVIDKFYYGKSLVDSRYTIKSVELMPSS